MCFEDKINVECKQVFAFAVLIKMVRLNNVMQWKETSISYYFHIVNRYLVYKTRQLSDLTLSRRLNVLRRSFLL